MAALVQWNATVPEAFYFTKRTVNERFVNGERSVNEKWSIHSECFRVSPYKLIS
jgi:hypothetical protein